MDLRRLKTLVDLVTGSAISELEVTDVGGKVRIIKAPPHVTAQPMPMQAEPAPVVGLPAVPTEPAALQRVAEHIRT